jgi:hypothetical protein
VAFREDRQMNDTAALDGGFMRADSGAGPGAFLILQIKRELLGAGELSGDTAAEMPSSI